MKALFIAFALLVIGNVHATNYYFSSSIGDDNRTAAQAQNPATPWRSISRLNSFFSSISDGDSILFKRGDVFYGAVTVAKSGKNKKPIVFSAYGNGDNPVITGLSIVNRWVSIGNGLYETTLSTPPSDQLMMVLFDGSLQPIGRYPKAGKGRQSYFYISNPDPIITRTVINSKDISAIPSFVGGELVQKKDQWIIDRSVITAQNSNTVVSTPQISPDHPTSIYPSWYNHGFFFQNHVNACTQLGDWCYNNATKKLVMYFGANSPSSYKVQVATTDDLFTLNGKDNITISNLTLSGTNRTLIKMQDVTNFKLDNCELSFTGVNGIAVNRGGWNGNTNNNTIVNCNFHDINNNGIDAVGSTDWTISNNYIHDIGMIAGMGLSGDAQYIGIFDVGSNSVVENNKIENIGYTGIYFSGNNTVVRRNELKNYVAVKSDGGGIYTYEYSGKNRLVENNICHDGIGDHYGINIDEANPYAGQVHGIYMDGNATDVTIRNNTCFNNSRSGIWLGSNANITVENNTLFNNTVGQICGNDAKSAFNKMKVKKNLLFSVEKEQLCLSLMIKSNYYSRAFDLDENFYCRPISEVQGINTAGYPNSNSLVNYPGGGVVEAYDGRFYSLDTWQKLTGLDGNAKKTPLSIPDKKSVLFDYNPSNSVKTIVLDGNYTDVTGKPYSGSVTIAPYSSVILLKGDGRGDNDDADFQALPGRVEAESFSVSQFVNLENCSEGGQNASGFGQGSFMNYNVNVASAGAYTFNFRAGGWGGKLQLRNASGAVLATVVIPSSKGWQNWSTISSTVNLPAGKQTLQIYVTEGGFNLNWFEAISNNPILINTQTISFASIAGKVTTDVPFTLNATATSGLPVSFKVISGPATIAGHTVTLTGAAGTVVVEASQAGNASYKAAPAVRQSFAVVTAKLNQTITIASIAGKKVGDGAFTVNATATSGLPVSLRVVSGPATISGNVVSLNGTAGTVTIEGTQSGNATYNAASPVTEIFAVSNVIVQANTYQPIPGRIEAEAYDAMQWVKVENCSEGGMNLTGFGHNSSMDYNVDVAKSGVYTMTFRVGGFGGKMEVRDKTGKVLGSIDVPSSFGWQKWSKVSVNVPLAQGKQTLKLHVKEGGFTLNWFEGISYSEGTQTYQPIPGRVEAEDYSSTQWVVLENCSEGGLNASGFGQGSFLDYNVDVASAGAYTLSFRVGGWGGQMQVKNASGSVLNTVNVPSAKGWQKWTTVSVNMNLPAGKQVLRFYVTTPGFTLNWFEGAKVVMSSAGSTVNQGTTAMVNESVSLAPSVNELSLYPVPVSSELTIQLSNANTGAVRASVVDQSGRILKDMRLQKQGQQLLHRVSVSDLPSGVYLLQVQMKESTITKTFVKK